jgi:hypothetical protein
MQHPPPVEVYLFWMLLFGVGIVLTWKNMLEEWREERDRHHPHDDDNDPDPFDGEGWAV